jgi:hypothetical protein
MMGDAIAQSHEPEDLFVNANRIPQHAASIG